MDNILYSKEGVRGTKGMRGTYCDNISIPPVHDYTYLALLRRIQSHEGRQKKDRTGVGTRSLFGHQMRFSLLGDVIPLLTTKKMHMPSIIHELVWYLSGSSNIRYLQENGVRIWNEWADENGDLGPVYGFQWRNWPTFKIVDSEVVDVIDGTTYHINASVVESRVDQIKDLLDDLKTNPDSRRLIVSAWNVGYIQDMKLPPCHYVFQFYTEEMTLDERIQWWRSKSGATEESTTFATHEGMDFLYVPRRYLSCMLNQRSADAFLGVPFNIAQYSILTHLFAKLTGMAAKEFIWSGGDCHIYDNHHEQVAEQLSRVPYQSPKLNIAATVDNFENLKYNDFEIVGYESHPAIKAKVAV